MSLDRGTAETGSMESAATLLMGIKKREIGQRPLAACSEARGGGLQRLFQSLSSPGAIG